MNTQPWHVHIVTGEPLDRIRKGNTDNMMAGVPPKREFPMREDYQGIHRQRQVDVAKQLFAAWALSAMTKSAEWIG